MSVTETVAKLEMVRKKLGALSTDAPALERRVAKARTVLEQAKLAMEVAIGTPGFEDDARAAESVRRAQAELDQASEARAAAEERLEVLQRGEKQLALEADQQRTAAQQAHLEASKTLLASRLQQGLPALGAYLRDLAALRALSGSSTWPEEIAHILQVNQAVNVRAFFAEGHAIADKVRAGCPVTP